MTQKTPKPGRPPLGEKKRQRLSMTLDPALVAGITKRAEAAGISASRMAEQLLERALRTSVQRLDPRLAKLGVEPEQLEALCRALGVTRLGLFGSALTDRFTPDSDVDLVAEFKPGTVRTLLDRGRIQMEFERLFGRPVDLVDLRLVDNPIRLREIRETRQELYAA